jgi:hypothetical protein
MKTITAKTTLRDPGFLRLRNPAVWVALLLAGSAVVGADAGWAQFFEQKLDYEAVFKEGLSPNGKRLNLSGKKIGDAGVRILAEKEFLRNVVELDLRYNTITERGAEALVGSAFLDGVVILDLRHNALSDAGVLWIAGSSALPKLEDLRLSWNEIHDLGGMALTLSKVRSQSLKKLDLRGNFLADETKKALQTAYKNAESLKLVD